ncbi:hypothetical protein FMUND_473 [Fusarium mundagurra]|uniref:Zn(2)-C6 fungal-type domain-containing protein n=1 Tax=Fusarium mundagurra TaxID=1567541 RepID=A0A8H6DPH7_9HYPO|nr:hypothetical protein FMUND_473 [Fusarium mundagurra]
MDKTPRRRAHGQRSRTGWYKPASGRNRVTRFLTPFICCFLSTQKIKCDENQPCCQQCCKRNRACNISSSRFRVYDRGSGPDPVTAPKPLKLSDPDPSDNSCRDADDDSISAHDINWRLFIGEDSRSLDADVSDETTNVPSPISNAVYDSGRILVQLANLAMVHLNETQPHLATVATTPGTSGAMSSPSSNSMAAQSEMPRRKSTVPEAFDFVVSPSSFGTDESLPHFPRNGRGTCSHTI